MINDYAQINGIKIYYEIHGDGAPLVVLHGGGSTIQTSFGNLIPFLAKRYRVIAVELQNHGRSGYRMEPQTFSQDADDVAALLQHLGINKASLFGFSNGGQTCIEISLRHPHIVHKLIIAAAPYKRRGFIPGFFEAMNGATIDNMPQPYQDAFLALTPDKDRLQIMFERDRDRMIAFKDWSDEQIQSITAPTLLLNGDKDVMTVENAVEMYRLIPNCQLAILPGIHGQYIGEFATSKNGVKDAATIMPLIEEFLDN